jgi:ATP-dependent DNA helicase RecQ
VEARDPLAAIDRGLLFLHDHGAIVLHGGFSVFRSPLTIRLLPEAKGRRAGGTDARATALTVGEAARGSEACA